ncbi:class A beta-lactamase-related serine hydrolase [Flavobacteriaceae bacterium AU392]|nr:class A beta-lactamase-related serine hydrolase [Flavobacteriaceae bacterium]RKM85941.1 class A beta-lactamase-related serine hydrolase [Flavobacteriaceae bacterium AU392]
MITKALYFFIFILSFFSCQTDKKVKYLEKTKSSKIDSLANRYLQLNRFSGTIVVAKDESIIYNKNFGLADYENNVPFSDETAFKVGEITEIITANIVIKMANHKKLQLADKISKYLPEIKSDLTINDVLSQRIKSKTHFSNTTKESNLDYNVLGSLIEKISEKSFQENIEDYSNYLGLENTYYTKIDPSIAVGYLYHNYRGNGLELQKSPSIDLENTFNFNGLKSTGSDLIKIIKSNPIELDIDGYLENDGFSYSVINNLENKTSIVVLSNRRQPVTKEISSSINAILIDEEYRLPLSRKPFDIDKTILKDFSGTYSINENVNIEVLNSNDSLFVLMGPNKIYLVPQSSNQFYMEQMDASMRFLRDSTETTNKIVLLDGFIDSDQQAIRIKK